MLVPKSTTATKNIMPTAIGSLFASADRIQHQAKATELVNNSKNGSIRVSNHDELERPSKYGTTKLETNERRARRTHTMGILVLAHDIMF